MRVPITALITLEVLTNVKTVLTNINGKQWKLMSKDDRTNLPQKKTEITTVKT